MGAREPEKMGLDKKLRASVCRKNKRQNSTGEFIRKPRDQVTQTICVSFGKIHQIFDLKKSVLII
jgi:hypothetical protein